MYNHLNRLFGGEKLNGDIPFDIQSNTQAIEVVFIIIWIEEICKTKMSYFIIYNPSRRHNHKIMENYTTTYVYPDLMITPPPNKKSK